MVTALSASSARNASWRGCSCRALLRAAVLLIISAIWPAIVRAAPVMVTDMTGRRVELASPAKRIVLGDGSLLTALALLEADPTAKLAGWSDNLARFDPATYAQYRRRFPGIAGIPVVGTAAAGGLSIEKVLALGPDLVILPSWLGAGAVMEQQLSAAGIPLVYVDFFEDPLRDTAPTMRLLGKLLGQDERAEAYVRFYEAHMGRIAAILAKASPERPRVFFHARAGGWDCCWTVGGGIGRMIEFAGGLNIAKEAVPRATGQISVEYLLMQDPEVYVAAGGVELPGAGGFTIGPGASPEAAREALRMGREDPFLGSLPAFTKGRAHALWLYFFHSPTNVLAVEAMAKWFHPELFAEIDPQRTLAEINRDFLAVPMVGTYWTEAPAAGTKTAPR